MVITSRASGEEHWVSPHFMAAAWGESKKQILTDPNVDAYSVRHPGLTEETTNNWVSWTQNRHVAQMVNLSQCHQCVYQC